MADLDLAGKRVFIRADLNVPQDDAGHITDDTRIRASLAGIRLALEGGAAVMVTSHLGRPDRGAVLRGRLAGAGGQAPVASCSAATCRSSATGSTASRSSPARSCCSRTAASTRARRRTTRRSRARCGAVRRLRERRLRHRAPRRGLDPRHRASSPRSPAPARCSPPSSTPWARALANPKRPLVAIVAGSKVSHQAHDPQVAGRRRSTS